MSLADDLTRTPMLRVSVALPGDATGGVVTLVNLGPDGAVSCRSIRWMGSGAATLWYQPALARRGLTFTTSETAAGLPVSFASRQWLPLSFLAQGEEQPVQALALLADDSAGHASTAGTYLVVF